ncbi:MAG: sulfite exporter TauE/SafE family protein [Bacilli bacterium]|nr:sulfite exporter TauE/SafE family protein [Bacilli bacterium]
MPVWLSKALFVVVVFLTNIIQAITGFAGTVLAMPFSIQLVGKPYAKPVLNAIALLVCIIVVVRNFKKIDWKCLLEIIVFMGIGMVAGFFLEKYLYSKWFLKIYGIIIVFIAIYYFFVDNPIKLPKPIGWVIMFLAGIIHMIFVSGGPLLIIAAKNKIKDKETFRATLSMVWVILNSSILVTDAVGGNFSLDQLWILLIMIPTVVISILIGKFALKKMSNNLFMKLTCVLLFISGFLVI